MKRLNLTIGDVFEIVIDDATKRYFQFIAIDENQLRSDVIRVFSTENRNQEPPPLDELVKDPVDFYAHCVIKVGVKYDFWGKVGNNSDVGNLDVVFRSSKDFGRDEILVSERWDVWKVKQNPVFVGKLRGDLISAEPGEVYPPAEIVYRIKYGQYQQPYQS